MVKLVDGHSGMKIAGLHLSLLAEGAGFDPQTVEVRPAEERGLHRKIDELIEDLVQLLGLSTLLEGAEARQSIKNSSYKLSCCYLTLDEEGPAMKSLCTLRSASVCLRTCASGLFGKAHSLPEIRLDSDILCTSPNSREVDMRRCCRGRRRSGRRASLRAGGVSVLRCAGFEREAQSVMTAFGGT